MPLSFSWGAAPPGVTTLVEEETGKVSVCVLSEAPWWLAALTRIDTEPLVAPLAAVYAVKVPLRTYITCGVLPCEPGVGGLAASARLGTARASARNTGSLFIAPISFEREWLLSA